MDHSLGLRSSRRARTPQSLYQSPCWPASDHRHISESGDLTNGLFVKEASSASSTDGAAHNAALQCRARRADKKPPDYLVASATPSRLWLRSLAPRICSYSVDLRPVVVEISSSSDLLVLGDRKSVV